MPYTHPPEREQVVEQYPNAIYRLVSVRNGLRVLRQFEDLQVAGAVDSALFLGALAGAAAETADHELEE